MPDDVGGIRQDRLRLAGTARDPRFKRPYTELVYQPMLELLAYLRAKGFKTFIVSGGGIEFMRPWTEKFYGIPPEQVVGSSIKTRFEMRDGRPVLFRLPEIKFIDDKAGKPLGINQHIGRRPITAFGNSDGDLEMLQWTTLVGRPALRPDRAPHRCRTRIRLRSRIRFRKARQGARCRGRQQMDNRRHEERLEAHIPRRVDARRAHPWEIVMMLKTCIARVNADHLQRRDPRRSCAPLRIGVRAVRGRGSGRRRAQSRVRARMPQHREPETRLFSTPACATSRGRGKSSQPSGKRSRTPIERSAPHWPN